MPVTDYTTEEELFMSIELPNPMAAEQEGGATVVTCRLMGNFPGSPVDLRFFFRLAGDKIAALEVIP
jgi:hypothetical protein